MRPNQIISVCQTPLHFIFTLSILENINTSASPIIIWIRESSIDQRFIEKITKHLGATLLCLKGTEKDAINSTINRVCNLRKIRSFKTLKNPIELYYFNDLGPEVQLLAKLAKKKGGTTSLVEDGVAIYDIGGEFKKNPLKALLGKLVYGCWWEKPRRIGETKLHDKIYAINPSITRRSINKNAKTQKLAINEKTLSYLFPYGETEPDSTVVLLPFIGSTSKVSEIDEYLRKSLLSFENKVYLKFHPQERIEIIDRLLAQSHYSNYEILPSNLPIEILFLRSPGKRTVVGFKTSALHTLKSFCTSVEPRYFREGLSDDWIKFYRAMGIEEYKNT